MLRRHLAPGGALRQVPRGMAIHFLGMLGEVFAAFAQPVQVDRCLSLVLPLASGQPSETIQAAVTVRTRCLSHLARTAEPDALLEVLDHQQMFFGAPEADFQGGALRITALVKLGRLAAARAFAAARHRLMRSQGVPAEMLAACAHAAASIPDTAGTDASLEVMSSRSLRRMAEGPVGEKLMEAGAKGDLAALEQLARPPFGIDASGTGFRTALHMAAFRRQLHAVSWLFEHGANLEATHVDSRSALMFAADQGHARVVALLLARGAQVNRQDCALQTALHLAAWQDHRDTLEVLLAHGVAPTCRDASGRTPLNLACAEDVPEAVSMLLRAGADTEDATELGHTPLMSAAMEGKARVVQVLLEAGARTGARDAEGHTALDWARLRGHGEVAELLEGAVRALD